MITPQQIEEITFSKAVFGGYDMEQVDEILEPLTQDYITLYKENATLKQKLKLLVEKFEQMRAEGAGANAVAETKAKCDAMLAEAQRKCDEMTKGAESDAAIGSRIAEETERLNCAKQTALNFIEVIEQDIKGHLDLLETLKSRDLKPELKTVRTEKPHEQPFDWQKFENTPSQSAEDIASEISENLEKLVGSEPAVVDVPAPEAVQPHHPESATIKFPDLQFGKNYDPKA